MARPLGITIIAVVAAINGLVLTIAGVSNLLNLRFPVLGELEVRAAVDLLGVGLGQAQRQLRRALQRRASPGCAPGSRRASSSHPAR